MKYRSLAILSVALNGAACGQEPSDLRLLRSDEVYDADAELERLRRMQMVRVEHQGGILEVTPESFVKALEYSVVGFPPFPFVGCGYPTFLALRHNQVGEVLLDIVNVRGPVVFTLPEMPVPGLLESQDPPPGFEWEGEYRVLTQSAASKAAVAQLTFAEFKRATLRAIGGLGEANLCDGIDLAATAFVEAYYGAENAVHGAVENIVAVADAQLGSSPSRELARMRGYSGAELSRAAAVHLLVGGIPGVLGKTEEALCTSNRLSAQAKAALDVFREAAVAPEDVLATEEFADAHLVPPANISINDLLNGSLSNGSVKARLEGFWGVTFPANSTVQNIYGLRDSDFESARVFLGQEMRAFSRSRTAVVVESMGGFDKFAATAVRPVSVDAAYYMALADSEFDPPTRIFPQVGGERWVSTVNIVKPTIDLEEGDYASYVDYAQRWARHLLGTTGFAQLALVTASDPREARIVDQSNDSTPEVRVVSVLSDKYGVGDGLLIVEGEDGLSCAVQGHVDGAPCSVSGTEFEAPSQFQINFGSVAEGHGFERAVSASYEISSDVAQRFYVVVPRWGDASGRPGTYRSIGGFFPYGHPGSGQWYRSIPVIPDVRQRVAEILAPSPEWCTGNSVTCAGVAFDERLPLEDELSDDGSNVESSWRYYLGLAKQAAAESDFLANQFLTSSVQLDSQEDAVREKASAALEGLQDICGTAVEVAPLLELFSSAGVQNFNLDEIDQGACDPPSAPAPAGTKCINGRAIVDWLVAGPQADSRLKPLLQCVASFDSTLELVHLGDTNVCLWRLDETLCGGSHPTNPCPQVSDRCDASVIPATAEPIPLAATDGLGLIDTAGNLPNDPDTNLCDHIREMRNEPAASASDWRIQKIVNSSLFHVFSLEKLRKRIGMDVDYGGYLSVTVDGNPMWSTGNSKAGPSSKWPCTENGGASAANCAEGDGLFCYHEPTECETRDGIAEANERLMNAVLAAHYMTTYRGAPEPGLMLLPAMIHPGVTNHLWESRNITVDQVVSDAEGPWPSVVPFVKKVYRDWSVFEPLAGIQPESRDAHAIGSIRYPDEDGQGRRFGTRKVVLPDDGSGATIRAEEYLKYFEGLSHEGAGEGLLLRSLTGRRSPIAGLGLRYNPDIAREESRPGVSFVYPEVVVGLSPASADAEILFGFNHEGFGDGQVIVQGQNVPTARFHIVVDRLLDGMELMCAVNEGVGGLGTNCGAPPVFETLDDLEAFGAYVECAGRNVQREAAVSVFEDMPQSIVRELRERSRAYETQPGQLGLAMSDLRLALQGAARVNKEIGRLVSSFGSVMRSLRHQLTIYELQEEMAQVRFQAEVVERVTQCVAAVADRAELRRFVTGGAAAAGALCVNAIAQIGFASKLRQLGDAITDAQRAESVNEFERDFQNILNELARQLDGLEGHLETIRASLSKIETLKQQARRSVDKALWYFTSQAATAGFASSKALARERYHRAHKNAQLMAFFAKRAIEQRLGVYLSDIAEDLPLVEAPQTWESSVCQTEPIDYDALKATFDEDIGRFADSFIGDYVQKLENVVESYRQKYSFHEGEDIAVASVRDDIQNVRAECTLPSRNLLFHSTDLDRYAPAPELLVLSPEEEELAGAQLRGWSARGCDVDPEEAPTNCIRITKLEESPLVDLGAMWGAPAYELLSGDGDGCQGPPDCTWQQGAMLAQDVEVPSGVYRYSWYRKAPGSSYALAGDVLINGQPVVPLDVVQEPNAGWVRNEIVFEADFGAEPAGVVTVGFVSADQADETVEVAAAMLEEVDADVPVEITRVGPYEATGSVREVIKPLCEDRDGTAFRLASWERKCELLCPDGYRRDCLEGGRQECFWETSFHINQRGLEAGDMFVQSGFARGNFNYRIDSVGLNFVGTGIRDCESSTTPSTCFSGGFVPYSLIHQGPYYVRNHWGDDFTAHLFEGRIEHARGLGNERYLSNPIGGTDTGLIEPYLRQELRGRPLDGQFVLRVWDEPGVNFHAIEDVQLVLKYRYWTRFR